MKKVYLLMSALMVGGVSLGQHAVPKGGLSPFAEPAHAAKTEKPEVKHDQPAIDRGAAIWSEDFSNGLNSTNGTWTVAGTNGNIWKQTWTPTNGCWSAGETVPLFTTAANGFMIFDCDSANCDDPVPNPPIFTSDPLEGELISPVIDLTGEMAVDIQFQQTFRFCCTNTLELFLGVSNDGGTTWTEFDVQGGVAVNNGSDDPDVVQINISSVAANQANVKIRFRWGGGISHYYWCVDDINLLPSPPHEVALSASAWRSASFAGSDHVPYTLVPDDQSQDFFFTGTTINQGSNTEDVTFTAEVLDGASSVFTSNGQDGAVTLAPGASSTDTSAAMWTSGTSVGTAYTVNLGFDYPNIGSDAIASNNEGGGSVTVTDFIYGRDNNTYTGSGLWNGAGNGYSMGPVYNMAGNGTLYSVQVALTGSTDPGTILFAEVYEIDAVTGDFVNIYTGNGTAFGEVDVTSSMISSSTSGIVLVNIPIDAGAGNFGINLSAGTEYIICAGHYGGDDIVLMNGQMVAPDQTVFLLDYTDNTWYYMTSTPLVRGNFDPASVDGVGITEESGTLSLGQNIPNPFNGNTRIMYSLTNSEDVTLVVTDVTGKVVETLYEGVKGAGNYTIDLNSDNYSQGVYFYTMTAGQYTATKRMVVTK